MTFDVVFKNTCAALTRANTQSPEAEAELIVIGAFRKAAGRNRTFSRTDLHMRALHDFPGEAAEILKEYLLRRIAGEPLAYILGYHYFFNHEYLVRPGVLIPRPETEILVLEALRVLKHSLADPVIGLEFGLGSGCISIELLKHFKNLKIVGLETSEVASQCARENAKAILEQGHLRLNVQAVLPSDISSYDFIISNPPYLSSEDEATVEVLKNEPKEALFVPEINGQRDPLYFYRILGSYFKTHLSKTGVMFLEVPHERANEISDYFKAFGRVRVLFDLSERPRVLLVFKGRSENEVDEYGLSENQGRRTTARYH